MLGWAYPGFVDTQDRSMMLPEVFNGTQATYLYP